MTFTARMADLIAKHRILVYTLMTLALTVYLVVGFTPANAVDTSIPSPADLAGSAKGNCAYLTFCRWNDLSQTGQPPIIGMPQLFIVNIMFMIAQFAFFLLGQIYILIDSFNLYYSLLYWGDGVFSMVSVVTPGGGVKVGSLLGIAIFAALAVLASALIFPKMSRRLGKSGKQSSLAKTAAWMVGGVVVLSVMATASAKNHDGTSPIGQLAGGADGAKNSINNGSVSEAAKNPSQWQPFSLGWVVAWGNTAAGAVGNIAVNTIKDVTSAMNVHTASEYTACDIYIDSMHSLYTNQNSLTVKGGVLGIESLYRAAVLNQYTTANFGGSDGAEDAWCRVLDVKTPVGEQVLIADNAKNVTSSGGHALYKTALDVMIDGNRNWIRNDSKTSIHENDQFKEQNFGAGLAMSYFAPPLTDPKSNTRASFSSYFAACKPENGSMTLRSEWEGVIQAGDKKETLKQLSANGRSICTAMANGDGEGMEFDDANPTKTVAIGFYDKATDATGDWGSSGKTDYQKRMMYTGGTTTDVVSLLFNGQGVNQTAKFISAEGGLSGPAYSYYGISTGILWGSGILSSLIMIFVTYLIVRISGPLLAGGVVAQFFGAMGMFIMPILLIALIVWPTDKVKGLNFKTFGVIIGGSLVSTLFTAVFLVYSGLFSFVNSVLTIRQGAQIAGPMVIENAFNGVGLALAGMISYSLMKIILSKTLNFDPTNLKTAMTSSANAVMSPIKNDGAFKGGVDGFKDAATSPFKNAMSLVKTPVQDTKNQYAGLRDRSSKIREGLLKKNSGEPKNASDLTPQGATSTGNNAGGRFNGTEKDPLTGIIIDSAGKTGTNGGPVVASASVVGQSNLTDEQQRQRLIDQVKKSYGTADAEKVFPNGVPADYEKLIAKAPLSEVQRLSKMLGSSVEASDGPRATPNEAAENMKKFAQMGEESLRSNPNGFDPSVGYAERSATQAQLFRSVNPLSDKDLAGMSDADLRNYNARKFDSIQTPIPDGRAVSFVNGSDVIKGEVVSDPLTERSVPNAVVRSGSQNLAPLEGVTQDGTSLFGAKRAEDKESWDISTLDSGARQLPPSMLSSSVPPAGVKPEQWNEVTDLHDWIRDENIQMDSTSMASWPAKRREQAGRVAEVMNNVMSSQGVPMVDPKNLESLADSGVGITSDSESFTFGESTPKSDFKPSGMRDAIAAGREKIAELQKASMERSEKMVSEKVDAQIAQVESTISAKEKLLGEKLEARLSLEAERATTRLSGLVSALEVSNLALAQKVSEMASNGDWDDILSELDSSEGDDENEDRIRDQIREIVENSKDRVRSMHRDHTDNISRLYAQLTEERESITERMHADIEADLENDIGRNVEGVRDIALSSASDTSRRHVEGMLSWFPAIKSRFFSGSSRSDADDSYDADDVEDVDADGIDDRVQANL